MSHLSEVGEGYFEHASFALRLSVILIVSGLAAVIHAVIPCLFKETASRAIRHLAVVLDERESKP